METNSFVQDHTLYTTENELLEPENQPENEKRHKTSNPNANSMRFFASFQQLYKDYKVFFWFFQGKNGRTTYFPHPKNGSTQVGDAGFDPAGFAKNQRLLPWYREVRRSRRRHVDNMLHHVGHTSSFGTWEFV